MRGQKLGSSWRAWQGFCSDSQKCPETKWKGLPSQGTSSGGELWWQMAVSPYKSPAKPRVHWSNISPLVTVLVMTKLLLSCREYFSILVGSLLQLTHLSRAHSAPMP